MLLLNLVILVCSFINVRTASDEKYIDLLPEEEKKAFLETVARRLINGVRTKDSRYKSSEELAEDELEQHGDYVRHVIEEESGNLRRSFNETKDSKHSDELKVKGIDKGEFVTDADDRNHIDLTLRQGHRMKRNEKQSREDEIPVNAVYDYGLDKKKTEESSAEKNNTKEKRVRKLYSGESSVEDIQVRGRRKSRKFNDSPNVQRNIISRGFTKIDNYDPEAATESDQKETEEDETTTDDSEKTSAKAGHLGFTAAIPNDSVEGENDNNNDKNPEDEGETTTETTLVTSDSDEVTASTSTVSNDTSETESTTELSTVNITESTTATTNKPDKQVTEKNANNSTVKSKKLYLRKKYEEEDIEEDSNKPSDIGRLDEEKFVESNTNVVSSLNSDSDMKVGDKTNLANLGSNKEYGEVTSDDKHSNNKNNLSRVDSVSETHIPENVAKSMENLVLKNKELLVSSESYVNLNRNENKPAGPGVNISKGDTEVKIEYTKNADGDDQTDASSGHIDDRSYEKHTEQSDITENPTTSTQDESHNEKEDKVLNIEENSSTMRSIVIDPETPKIARNHKKSDSLENPVAANEETSTTITTSKEHEENEEINQSGISNTETLVDISGNQSETETIINNTNNQTPIKLIETQDITENVTESVQGEPFHKIDTHISKSEENTPVNSEESKTHHRTPHVPRSNEKSDSPENPGTTNVETIPLTLTKHNEDEEESIETKISDNVTINSHITGKHEELQTKEDATSIKTDDSNETVTELQDTTKIGTYSGQNEAFNENHTNILRDKDNSSDTHLTDINIDHNTLDIARSDNQGSQENSVDTNKELSTSILIKKHNKDRDSGESTKTDQSDNGAKNNNNITEKKQEDKLFKDKEGVEYASDEKASARSASDEKFVLTTTERSYTTLSEIIATPTYTAENISLKVKKNVNNELNNSFNDGEARNDTKDSKSDINDIDYMQQSANLKNILEILRQGVESHVNSKHPKVVSGSVVKKTKEYVVYELPEGETPFIKGKELSFTKEETSYNQDQPHYVPIYNYSPKHAYYNAYNRLGPNVEDNDDDENVTTAFGSRIDNTVSSSEEVFEKKSELRIFKRTKENSRPKTNTRFKTKSIFSLPLQTVAKTPKVNEIFNSGDYFDMDYYYGRSGHKGDFRKKKNSLRQFCRHGECSTSAYASELDSAEAYHPYNLMKTNTAKDHINAVRQFLYKQKHFGFVPDLKPIVENTTPKDKENKTFYRTQDIRPKNITDIIILLPSHTLESTLDFFNDDRISLDYLFGIDADRGSKHITNIYRSRADDDNKSDEIKENRTNHISQFFEDTQTQRRYKSKHDKELEQAKLKWKENAGSIKDILSISDTNDVFPHLEKLRQLNLSYLRQGPELPQSDLDVYVNVLKDMVEMDNKALVQYDWLGTTVDVLSALKKLEYITNRHLNQKNLPPADNKLLKYVLHLYNSAKSSINESESLRDDKKKKHPLPRNKNRIKSYLKAKGLINRIWLYFRARESDTGKDLEDHNDFLTFLGDLKSSMYDLHNALKHIAMVTKYKQQNWFKNLKEIYMKNPNKKYLLEVLLHISTSRLVALIEENAANEMEDTERKSMKVKRSTEEFVFILKLLNEFKKLDRKKVVCDSD